MRIQKILLLIMVTLFLVSVVVVPSVFSANIGRNVYSVLSETYNGATYYPDAVLSSPDEDAIHMDIWNDTFNSNTVEESTATPDVYAYEGNSYTELTVKSISGEDTYRWGAVAFRAINTSTYKDMSSYYNGYLNFYARASSSDSEVENYEVGLLFDPNVTPDDDDDDVTIWLKTLSQCGFVADGEWHYISIPLTNDSLTSGNMAKCRDLFLLKGANENFVLDNVIDIDNIVWVKNGVGTFAPTLKRINGDVATTTITWNSGSVMGNNAGWTVADQYIELDLDMNVYTSASTTWAVRIYTDNGAIDRNGLMSPSNQKIPLCWRADDYKLPYEVGSDTRTLTIGEVIVSTTTGAQLYDAGAVTNPEDANYWCWFWMLDKEENHTEDYNVIWDNRGFHGAENEGKFWGMNQTLGIYPRIYLGAKFIDIVGGQSYSATITVELAYE